MANNLTPFRSVMPIEEAQTRIRLAMQWGIDLASKVRVESRALAGVEVISALMIRAAWRMSGDHLKKEISELNISLSALTTNFEQIAIGHGATEAELEPFREITQQLKKGADAVIKGDGDGGKAIREAFPNSPLAQRFPDLALNRRAGLTDSKRYLADLGIAKRNTPGTDQSRIEEIEAELRAGAAQANVKAAEILKSLLFDSKGNKRTPRQKSKYLSRCINDRLNELRQYGDII